MADHFSDPTCVGQLRDLAHSYERIPERIGD